MSAGPAPSRPRAGGCRAWPSRRRAPLQDHGPDATALTADTAAFTKAAKAALRQFEAVAEVVMEAQRAHHLALSCGVQAGFMPAVFRWASGDDDWGGIVEEAFGGHEGDLIRARRRLIDLLRQLGEAPEVPGLLAARLGEAARVIDRGIVLESALIWGCSLSVRRTPLAVALAALLLGGCAAALDQRAIEGLEAVRIWKLRFAGSYGRAPSFEEARGFEDRLEQRIRAYLDGHPAVANSLRATTLRFWRRVAVGMTKEEILLLLDKPDDTASDPARMEAAARRFWPEVKKRAKETWSYPGGWSLYFEGEELVDLTVYRFQFLQD